MVTKRGPNIRLTTVARLFYTRGPLGLESGVKKGRKASDRNEFDSHLGILLIFGARVCLRSCRTGIPAAKILAFAGLGLDQFPIA